MKIKKYVVLIYIKVDSKDHDNPAAVKYLFHGGLFADVVQYSQVTGDRAERGNFTHRIQFVANPASVTVFSGIEHVHTAIRMFKRRNWKFNQHYKYSLKIVNLASKEGRMLELSDVRSRKFFNRNNVITSFEDAGQERLYRMGVHTGDIFRFKQTGQPLFSLNRKGTSKQTIAELNKLVAERAKLVTPKADLTLHPAPTIPQPSILI